MAALSIRQSFGGVAFLDDGFDARRLLGAVIAGRAFRLGVTAVEDMGEDARLLLVPRVARALLASPRDPDIRSVPLSPDERRAVIETFGAIRRRMPVWAPLLDLPIELRSLRESGAISCSCMSWPQHVFLAPEAFSSRLELAEQVLHELSHNWLYLVEELTPLATATACSRFVLPSGTGGRDITEVLGAGCVASMLVRWYEDHPDPRAPERRRHLARYLHGCLGILHGPDAGELTRAGMEVRASLDARMAAQLARLSS